MSTPAFRRAFGFNEARVTSSIASNGAIAVAAKAGYRVIVGRIRNKVTGDFTLETGSLGSSSVVGSFTGGTNLDVPGLEIRCDVGENLIVKGTDTGPDVTIEYGYEQVPDPTDRFK